MHLLDEILTKCAKESESKMKGICDSELSYHNELSNDQLSELEQKVNESKSAMVDSIGKSIRSPHT
jgi:F0F1-type ATP synthase delta subunit